MPGIGLFPLRIKSAIPAGPPPPIPVETLLADGNTVAWYDYNQLSTITKDGSNFVSRWNDRLGSGRDLMQATGTNQPLWQADGILFDGVDNYLRSAALTYNQPAHMYVVVKVVNWGYSFAIVDGYSVGERLLLGQSGSTQNLLIYAGVVSGNTPFDKTNTAIMRAVFNGANSRFQINGNAPWTGNAGTYNAGGLTIGGSYNYLPSYSANILVKEMVFRKGVDTTENETTIYNYLKTKYGL